MKAIKQFIKACLFLSLLVLSLHELDQLFILGPFTSEERISGDNRASFQSLDPNSLDVVYVGASNVYAFWQAPLAWDRYGLASHTYTNSSMPAAALRYAIQYCRKTQPNALYVVNLNNFKIEGDEWISHAHWTTDTFPRSLERLELIDVLCKQNDFDFDERLELYFPLLRFHSTWSEMKRDDFVKIRPDVAGGATNAGLYHTEDVTKLFKQQEKLLLDIRSNGAVESKVGHNSLDDLIKYCKENSVSILFVDQPQAITDRDHLTQLEVVRQIVLDSGLDYIDLSDPNSINLIKTEDFKDNLHTNIHGSIKYTDYLAQYIMDTYDIPDRRNDDRYERLFDESLRYKQLLQTHIVREYEFDVPEYRSDLRVSGIEANNLHMCTYLKWEPIETADEYLVYRQEDSNIYNPYEVDDIDKYGWKCIARLSSGATSFVDTDVRDNLPLHDLLEQGGANDGATDIVTTKFNYCVIPIINDGNDVIFGSNNPDIAQVEVSVLDDGGDI